MSPSTRTPQDEPWIDSTDLEALAWNDDASWASDPTAEEYYYGFGLSGLYRTKNTDCCGVYAGEASLNGDGDARHALAVAHPIWMLGDSADRPVQSAKYR